jgi:glyoxylase-like metal-dependent hydrolase (beta-lactamase superfamily II)
MLGPLTLQPLSDGILRLDPGSVFAEAPEHLWRPLVQLDSDGRIELSLACLLVAVGERRILIDTGFGFRADNPLVGHLVESLGALGVNAAEIDTVIISHPHGDHIGGAATGIGEQAVPTFPRARYWLGQADWDHFSPPEMLASRGLVDKLPPLARAQCLDLADSGLEIAPGVHLLPLPGHTPGHQGVAFTAGQQTAVYIGDAMHHPLQVEHPDWSPTFDALPRMSADTRRALVERARRERSLVLSYHFPWPGVGHFDSTWQPRPYTLAS